MVNKSSRIKLKEQVIEHMLAKIRCKEWPSGHRLPGERRLAETLQVCRATVVEALDYLENKRIIDKLRSRGNFVCRTNTKLKILFPFPEKEIPRGNHLPGEGLLLMNELQRGMMCGASEAGVHFFLDFFPDPGNDPDILERYLERFSEFDAIIWGGPQQLRLRERMYGRKPMVIIGKRENYGQEDRRNCSHVYYDWLSAIRELLKHGYEKGYREAAVINLKQNDYFLQRTGIFQEEARKIGFKIDEGDLHQSDLKHLPETLKSCRNKFVLSNSSDCVADLYEAAEKVGMRPGAGFMPVFICSGLTLMGVYPRPVFMRVPIWEMGAEAIRMAARQVRSGQKKDIESVDLTAELFA